MDTDEGPRMTTLDEVDVSASTEIVLHEDKKYYPEASEVYGEDAEINVYDLRTGTSTSCSGTACVTAAFAPLFELDRTTASFVVNNVDEGDPENGVGGTVLLYFTWAGVATEWTDTFLFDTDGE